MAQFKGISGLQQSLKQQTQNFMGSEVKLALEAERLRECIQKYIDLYYETNEPKYYQRTKSLKSALQVSTQIKRNGDHLTIGLYFDEDLSYGRKGKQYSNPGWTPGLINYGWDISEKTGFERYKFDYYEGFGFIEKGIAEWQQTAPLGMRVINNIAWY